MGQLKNLGDLFNRDRDMTKLAVIDLGGEESPCEYCYAELDAMTTGVARGLAKREKHAEHRCGAPHNLR
jgi:hypothetical protein